MSSTLTVLFFAAARQRTQCSRLIHPFDSPYTLKALKDELCEIYPELIELIPYLRWAVNHSFVHDDQLLLNHRDEVALIPPISGG